MFKHSARISGGEFIRTDADGKETRADSKTCCHCNTPFVVRAGSGILRGRCTLCGPDAWTCGGSKCHEHFPFEERMDLYEKDLLPSLDASRDQAKVKRFIHS